MGGDGGEDEGVGEAVEAVAPEVEVAGESR